MQRRVQVFDESYGALTPGAARVERSPLEFAEAEITAIDLIRFRIERELERSEDAMQAMVSGRTSTTEQVLNSPPTIARGFAAPAARLANPTGIDKALAEAVEAFEQGRFLFLVNDRQIRTTTEPIRLQEVNAAVFLRLLPLKGG
ncbi:MAG: hypothetical protein H6842_14340 [Rhodospirillaceae bacterium]|nr:hypothetical protein [Rhodospirillaceae bacterium]